MHEVHVIPVESWGQRKPPEPMTLIALDGTVWREVVCVTDNGEATIDTDLYKTAAKLGVYCGDGVVACVTRKVYD